jgi:hypothetical protein
MPEKSNPIPKRLSYPVFLLQTVYFSPIIYTLYPLLGALLAIFTATGDLTKHNVFLALYAAGLSGFVIGPFLCIREPNGHFRLNPSILLLPMELKDILKKTLLSSILYGIIITGILLVLMTLQLRLPNIQNPGIDFMQTPGGARLPVATGTVWDAEGKAAIAYREVLDPSLIFGIVKSTAGFPVFPVWPVCFFLLFTAVIAYFSTATAFKPFMHQKSILRIIHGALLVFYVFIGVIIAADVMLDSDILWRWRNFLDQHAFILPTAVFILSAFFASGIVLQYQQSRKQNQE